MIGGGEVLVGIFGNSAYDVVKRACSALWPSATSDPVSERIGRLSYDAFERATSRFFAEYGEAFGSPGASFLARAENLERVLLSVYQHGDDIGALSLKREGYDGAPSATDAAVRFFIDAVEQEMRRHVELDRLLTEKANSSRLERIEGRVDVLIGIRSTDAADLRPAAPAPPTNFVGRVELRAAAALALARSQTLVLVGMGGVGKTATALRVVADTAADFPGGALWGALSTHGGDPAPLLRSWARACHHPVAADVPLDELPDIVRSVLSGYGAREGRRFLVAIDDAREEWMEALATLRAVLPVGTPLLLTSRHERVAAALAGEVLHVDPLSTDSSVALLDAYFADAGPEDRAYELALADEVGHLPLALVLLGKRLALFAAKPGYRVADLLADVRRRPLDAPHFPGEPRLRTVLAISYDALEGEVRSVFRSVGAFARPVVAVDDLAVVADVSVGVAGECLDALVLSSLAEWDPTPGRYAFHPLLQEYAASLLLHTAEEHAAVCARHAAQFVAHAERQASQVATDRPAAFAAMEDRLPEYQRAAAYLAQSTDTLGATRLDALASALWQESDFFPTRGEYAEAVPILEYAHRATRQAGMERSRSIHAGHLGVCLGHLGRLPEAIRYVEEAVALCRREGNEWDEGAHLGNLGTLYRSAGDRIRGIELFGAALKAAQRAGRLDVVLDILGNLGSAFRHHDPSRAERYYRAARALSEQTGDALGAANATSNLGLLYFDIGDLETAERLIQDALRRAESLGDRRGVANRLGHLGNILLRRGDLAAARASFERALTACREIGWQANEVPWIIGLGNVARNAGEPTEARSWYEEAVRAASDIGDPLSAAFAQFNLAVLRHEGGDSDGARSLLHQALPALRGGAPREAVKAEALLRAL